ncbi:Coenzyme A biosynthesis bifunctional protein CoaBC [Methanosarcinaceae archaeon Ag5]|uniref:Coenzyme A biosynthesis bifunctional protein CoaBC n=1 Tax=Methanolapillus africanus TaxID=3028297 RepID=A0AAE4SDL5_9EURY|nr:Coenzyme A biosynthesis bifunctional protein CoaBC [Methanosarcinaceae archaeon Ag5]
MSAGKSNQKSADVQKNAGAESKGKQKQAASKAGSGKPGKTMKLAWGITGAGDRLDETVVVMKELKSLGYSLDVFVSVEGETVLKWYKDLDEIQNEFSSFHVEKSANSPFILGDLQTGKYDALVIAPATANTVAKIAHGISDTLLTNAVAQAAKCDLPIYVFAVDAKGGKVKTKAPDGRTFTLSMRKVDVKNAKTVSKMESITVVKNPAKLIKKIA